MVWPSALTTDQYDKLRGTDTVNPSYRSQQFVAFSPNVVIFEALVNGAPTGTSYAQVSFDTVTTGAYTDIEDGQTVFIGSDSNIRNATFVGRVRKAPTSSILYINETSRPIANNAHIWVIRDWRLWDRLARPVSGGGQYKDFDLAYQLAPPIIYNLQSAYAGVVNNSGVYSQAFAPLALAVASGAMIASWQWLVPDGMTITVGSDTSQNITAEFEDGFNDWVTVKATDSNGKVGVFHFTVVAVAKDFSNVVTLETSGSRLEASELGWNGGLDAFGGVQNILNGTRVVIFDREVHQGERGSLFSNIKFVGNIRTETNTSQADLDRGVLKKASFELEGIAEQLNREEHLPFTLRDKSSPSAWDEVKNLSIWRGIAYSMIWHTTLPTIYSIKFDSTDNTFAYPLLLTQGGNMLGVIQDFMTSINGVLQSSPAGEIEIVRQAVYQTTSQRNALPTVANFTSADWVDIEPTFEHPAKSGKVNASGGTYNTVNGKDTPFLSIAPGIAQEEGAEIGALTRQVLAANVTQVVAQLELDTRAGHHYELVRKTPDTLTVTMRGCYNWLTPAVNRWYTWTIAASDTRTGRTFDTSTRWLCTAVSVSHNHETGTKDVRATFRRETAGTPGQAPPSAAVGQVKPALPVTPIGVVNYPNFPPPITISLPLDPVEDDEPTYKTPAIMADGNTAIFWSSTRGWITRNLLTTNKDVKEKTPPNSLGNLTYQWEGNGSRGLYALSNDGTNSRFHYAADAFENPPVWADTNLPGYVYTKIRAGSSPGKVYVEGITLSDDVLTAAWQVYPGRGTEITEERTDTSITVEAEFGPGSQYNLIIWTNNNPLACGYIGATDAVTLEGGYTASQVIPCGGTFPDDLAGAFIGGCLNYIAFASADPFKMQFTFSEDPECGSASVPITKIAYSADFGGTFATPKTITPSLSSEVGFDAEKIGISTLVGGVGQVYIATGDGGDYAAYGSAFPDGGAPNAIWVAPKTFAGGSNSGSTPQYIAASAALTEDDTSIWRVTSSGTVFTSITPSVSGDYGTIVGSDALTQHFKNATRIAAIFDFAGTRKLMTSASSGTSWSNRGNLDAAAAYVRYRRGDLTFKQIFIANGDAGLKVSVDGGANLKTKAVPTADAILGIEPY